MVDGLRFLPIIFVPPVTQEVFICAFTHLNDGRATLAHDLGQEIQRNTHIVGDRFILQPYEQAQEILSVFVIDKGFVMFGVIALTDPAGVFELVGAFLSLVSDRESYDRPVHEFAHECNVQAGIHSAGEQNPKWNIRYHTAAD